MDCPHCDAGAVTAPLEHDEHDGYVTVACCPHCDQCANPLQAARTLGSDAKLLFANGQRHVICRPKQPLATQGSLQ